jgi:Ca2+-binding EF-hand superfamily protein
MRAFIQAGSASALLLGCCLLCAPTEEARGAAGPLPPDKAERSDQDVQDLVFFSETRPLLVRLRIRIDGKPFRSVWEAQMDRLFRYLDVNGDGVLSKEEADRLPSVQTLLSGGGFGRGRVVPPALMPGGRRDGKMSRADVAEFYRRGGAGPFQFRYGPGAPDQNVRFFAATGQLMNGGPPTGDALNERLFNLLDTNKDGKLSREELAAAPKVLARLDADEDEMVTPGEIMGTARVGGGANEVVAQVAFTADYDLLLREGLNGPFYVVQSNAGDSNLARRLLNQYGAKGARKLTAKALGLDRETFTQLDADGDGELDAEELARFARRTPDAELAIRIGKGGKAAVELLKARPGLAKHFSNKDGKPVLDMNNTRVELNVGVAAPADNQLSINVRQRLLMVFKTADTDKNGYLDEAEARQSPFRTLFKVMDRDGDGKLYEKEVVAYFDAMKALSDGAMASMVSLQVSDHGKGLFDMLDTDGDGRLSQRELRQLPKLVGALASKPDGSVSRAEVPRSYRATFQQGSANAPSGPRKFVVALNGGMAQRVPVPVRTAGPLWFRKMDRNRDGDVSRREFLGSDEDFRRIDTDGDGLISVEEAIAYDKLKRKRRE